MPPGRRRIAGFATACAVAAAVFPAACARPTPPAPAKKIRVGVATFAHETCTFCPEPTGVAEWEFYGPPERGEAVLARNEYIRGFVKAAKEYDNVELVGILSPREAKGGSSGSWITQEAFDKYTTGIADDLRAHGPFDGVYLALHGAMAVTGVPKPEAEIVRRVRAAVGQIPIVATFDLHANEDHEFLEVADAGLIVKRYPHYDAALQGERALRLLLRMIKGDYKPTKATRKPGVITPSVVQGTGTSPAMEIMERARIWEERTPDAYVSVAFGFAYADVPDVGATVMVVTNNDQALADRIAQDMSDFIWKKREAFAGRKLPKVKEGVAEALAAQRAGRVPVVVADHADRTGNSTWILEELLRQRARRACVATIADAKAIDAIAAKAKVGERVRVPVGGYADPYAGRPVTIDGTVEYLGPYEQHRTVAVLGYGEANHLILTPVLHQVTDPGILDALHIGLANCDLVVIKSRVHFWRGFVEDGLAKAVVVIDAPGLGPADLTTIPYKIAPVKDLYPLGRRD
jgi:microcystin degradation protein MlrC